MKKRRAKLLSALLALSIVLALFPVTALAAEPRVVSPTNFEVRDSDGNRVLYTDQETVLDGGKEQKVYIYPEGSNFSLSYHSDKFTGIRNLTTNKQIPVGDSFTLPKDGCVYKISYKSIGEYITYIKCDERFLVPDSDALMASQESTGTTKSIYKGAREVYEVEVLLYPAGTVFTAVRGREIRNVSVLGSVGNDYDVEEPDSFTLPDDGVIYDIYVPSEYDYSWSPKKTSFYVKAGNGERFQPVKTYAPGTFADVPANEWYADNVKLAYELDLVSGTNATTFSPKDNISVAATITLAARIHSLYVTGQTDFPQGNPWYQPYVDYAVKNGIIRAGQFSDYNANISRRDFAGIMCHTMPIGEFQTINTIEDSSIPDVADGSAYCDEIYTFYKAGISVGNDEAGTFTPEAAIQRSAAAALVTRMVDPSLRIKDVKLTTIVRPTSITLDSSASSVEVNRSIRLYATSEPSEITVPITWTSSNPNVASVSSNGVVHGVSAGTATITAACGNVSASCTVTVTPVEAIDPMNYAYNALKYLHDHLKFPNTMKILSIRCGIYDRGGRDGTIFSFNDKYYAVTITYQAANSLGAMVTDSYVTLFNQTTGKVYYDFVGYTESFIDDAWGARKMAWMNLKIEALGLEGGGTLSPLTEAQIQQLVNQVTK